MVLCASEDSSFSLVRMDGSSQYRVEAFGSEPKDRVSFDHIFGRLFSSPYAVYGVPLTTLMKTPGFQLVSAEEVETGERKLFKIEISFGPPPASKALIFFDTEAGWAIRRSELRPGVLPGEVFVDEVAYKPTEEGIPFPVSIDHREVDGNLRCEFAQIVFKGTPEVEFTMPYYGLPDLTEPVVRPRDRLAYWLAGLMALVLVSAVSSRWAFRRTRSKVA